MYRDLSIVDMLASTPYAILGYPSGSVLPAVRGTRDDFMVLARAGRVEAFGRHHGGKLELLTALEWRALGIEIRHGRHSTGEGSGWSDLLFPADKLKAAFPATAVGNGVAIPARARAKPGPKSNAARDAEIRRLIVEAGKRPGEHGQTWDGFCGLVRDGADGWFNKRQGDYNPGFSPKVIERVARKQMAAQEAPAGVRAKGTE